MPTLYELFVKVYWHGWQSGLVIGISLGIMAALFAVAAYESYKYETKQQKKTDQEGDV